MLPFTGRESETPSVTSTWGFFFLRATLSLFLLLRQLTTATTVLTYYLELEKSPLDIKRCSAPLPISAVVVKLTEGYTLPILAFMTRTHKGTKMSRLDGAKSAARAEIEAFVIENFKSFVRELNDKDLESIKNLKDFSFCIKESIDINSKKDYNSSIRNQIAYAKGRELALNRISKGYELLESNKVCELLSITRQALSKKVSNGQVISYTVNCKKKLYPSFQFKENNVNTNIEKIIKETVVDPNNTEKVNMLLGFLLTKMDFSKIGEKDNIKPRYELINDKDAFNVIVQEFRGIGKM